VAYIIAEPCIGTKDTACVDVCPVDCIHPAKGRTYDDGRPTFDEVPQLYIDPTECIDCGACVPVCPATAIFPLDDLAEKWRAYIDINKNHWVRAAFDELRLSRLGAFVHPENVASIRVLEKVGFHAERRVTVMGMESIVFLLDAKTGEGSH
jgi:NAD-dependent dihydropyrimidine dehydrogenase PreA subunit